MSAPTPSKHPHRKTFLDARLLLALLFLLALAAPMPVVLPQAAYAEVAQVAYMDALGSQNSPRECTEVTAQGGGALDNGWYAVTEDVQFDNWVEISGDVNLILCDGTTLTAASGVHVPDGASLTIWAQSKYAANSNTGKLVSVGNNTLSGIGSKRGESGGSVIINGGNIDCSVNGQTNLRAPGIGGSTITINGGKVQAVGRYGAGIGSHFEQGCGDITINGGEVHAESKLQGAGIGSAGEGENGGTVTINGGKVTAISAVGSAAIGGGFKRHLNGVTISGGTVTARTSGGGAGIGGGEKAESGSVTISGGEVTASGGGAGIGSGDQENNTCSITISGGTVTATGGGGAAGIGAGKSASSKGPITISGATVTATGKGGGAGIGGGWSGAVDGNLEGSVNIKGDAQVFATGSGGGAGIGAGHGGNAKDGHVHISGNAKVTAIGSDGGAGIGGGKETSGAVFIVPVTDIGGEGCNDVRIEGNASVFAQSGEGSCSAIGHGDNDNEMGSISFSDNMCVKAGNDLDGIDGKYERLFTVAERKEACQYRHKALIQPCDHPGTATFVSIGTGGHSRDNCAYCGHVFQEEPHRFDDETRTCTVCGYGYDGELVTISFDANDGGGTMESVTYMPEALYAPPACGFVPPEGKTFQGWLVTAAGTGAQDPVSGLHFPGEPFILPGGGDVVLKAQWDGGASVTFSPGEGTGSMEAAEVAVGSRYPLPTYEAFTAPEGCSFKGWQVSSDTTSLKQPHEEISVTGDTLVTAIWERKVREPYANSLTYNGSAQELVAPGFVGGAKLVYALGSDSATQPDASAYDASVPRAKDAGTYYVWYKTEDAEGAQGATSGCLTATIWKADIAILADDVIGPDPQTATGSPLTWHVSGALAAGDEEGLGIRLSLGEQNATSPRAYPIRVSYNANANYNITTREGVYTVDEALEFTVSGYKGEYDGTAHSFEMSSNGKYLGWAHSMSELSVPAGLSNEELERFFSSAGDSETSFKDVGAYKAYYYILTNDHSVISGSVDVTITPKPLWVVADAKSKVEGEGDPALTYRTEGLEEGDSLTGRLVRDEGESVGTYAIRQGTLSASANYALRWVPSTMTIYARSQGTPSEPSPTVNPDPATSVVDKSQLRKLVGEAEGFAAEAYTQDSYGPYLAAVSAGKAVLDNARATQADVNAACTSIVAAREALEPAPSTPEPSDSQTEQDGWRCDASGTWYYLRDGKRIVGWMYDGGTKEWYHFSDDGSMDVGWISWQGRWYYLSRKHDGRYGKLSVGWFFDGSDWYFGQQEHDGHYGAIRVGWIYDGSGWYFGNQEHDGRYGAVLAGWIEDGGKRYYLSELHDGSYGRWIA